MKTVIRRGVRIRQLESAAICSASGARHARRRRCLVFRPPLFSDLPVWPGTPVVLGFCMVSNVPILYYGYRSTRQFRGPAHWFSGGVVV